MIKKILVANRGEIACRVFASAKRMGIGSVAVYSDIDAHALHTRSADEAICIGGESAAESYLVAEKIIDACKQSGADAVHPGYGFLSEQAEFAERLSEEGITLIGPSADAMRQMGDKITSKKLSKDAGVNTIPGFMGLIDDGDHCVKIAAEIGYPVMIKASAGGGGKGMRIAWNDDEARSGFDRSKSEAQSSFGDDRIFVEKFITNPRHIEIQVLADKHGNCIYLGERECSIQRRNQKVVEEAPSPFLDEETRRAMGEQSVALSRAVSYSSAGTVEFVVDENRNFYFLEMNTRLQVEHPVTELITGVDLVEQMIKVAAGEKLELKQSDIVLNGWAMESRIYAEDPYRNFLPCIGRVDQYSAPELNEKDAIVRCDSGIDAGGEISLFYDPMIAKLCTWAPTRESSIALMSQSLDQFRLRGVGNNLPFLSAIMSHPRFQEGRLTTAFIDEEFPDGVEPIQLNADMQHRFVCIGAVLQRIVDYQATLDVSSAKVLQGANSKQADVVRLNGVNFPVNLLEDDDGFKVYVGDKKPSSVETDWVPNQKSVTAHIDGEICYFQLDDFAQGFSLTHAGASANLRVLSERKAELANRMIEKVPVDTSNLLLCPMPGKVISLHVKEGDVVEEGQALAVVEAMKMENLLSAQASGTVLKLHVNAGDNLQVDEVIMEFEK